MAGIKFRGWALNHHCKNIGGYKFGSSVRDRHMYICKYEIMADFIWRSKARPPNRQIQFPTKFPAIQYVAYDTLMTLYQLHSMTTLRLSLGDSSQYEVPVSTSNKIKRAQPQSLSQLLLVHFSQGRQKQSGS